jgi:circadian clock protein KaiC
MQEVKKSLEIQKVLTGISGLDKITEGGLPKNRTTLIVGGPGCGKTIMALEFLVKGAREYDEPGVLLAFEEDVGELFVNVASLNYDLDGLVAEKKLYLEHVEIGCSEIIETGEFDLEGLFVRLGNAIDRIGAKRVVLDSFDALFYMLKYEVLRRELKRLLSWLKKKGVTTIITAEAGEKLLTRQGLEEYVVDCAILLDKRVVNQISTRRLRIIKYRGSIHGNNEYPFTISEQGMVIFPIISEIQDIAISLERISSGIKGVDEMLGGKGFFKGSSILVSGSTGTGKSSIAMSFVNECCIKKIRCLYCAFEEGPQQIMRNMKSIGLDMEQYKNSGYLQFYFHRPTLQNLELHLMVIQKIIEEYDPGVVVLDPVTNIMSEGADNEIRFMLVKFVDFLKNKQITILFTAAITLETIKSSLSDEGISSMVDTWILIRDIESNGERNRALYVLKSRGMKHSARIREFVITDKGIELLPVFTADGKVLTGSAKKTYVLREKNKISSERRLRKDEDEFQNQIKKIEAGIAKLKVQIEELQDSEDASFVKKNLVQRDDKFN